MPTSDRRASVDDPGPANTCPPQFSQKRPRRSERIRPPTRLPDSRSTVSQCRSLHPAARPARPPPTTTTSFIGRTSLQQCTNILLIYLLNVDGSQGLVNGAQASADQADGSTSAVPRSRAISSRNVVRIRSTL